MQAMALWSNSNADTYPLPSELDKSDTTVSLKGEAKDTTANIFSILVQSGLVAPEFFISPADVNPQIEQVTNYQFSKPVAAVDPDKALWDPAFSADFTGNKKSNTSYAHMRIDGARRAKWSSTFESSLPQLGNRGPEVLAVKYDAAGLPRPKLVNTNSNTLQIHGTRTGWEGNIGYADGSVSFETNMSSERTTFRDAQDQPWHDVLFFDEPEDSQGTNAFLGVFTAAGKDKGDFIAIWD